jgi:hypothetical protein
MRTVIASAAVFAFAATVFACSGSADDAANPTDQGTEQDIKSAKNALQGSWKIEAASENLTSDLSYDFDANGTFSRQVRKVLNGLFLPGHEPTETQSGTYTVDTVKKQVTLHIDSPNETEETYSYNVQPGKVLNGIFLPGHEPPPSHTVLSLTGVPAPMSHIAFPTLKYDLVGTVGAAEGESCGADVAIRKECAAGLTCVFPAGVPVSEHTPGVCKMVSQKGGECGDDVAIRKVCADGLTCVFPSGAPISEHTPGVCE